MLRTVYEKNYSKLVREDDYPPYQDKEYNAFRAEPMPGRRFFVLKSGI